MAENASDVQLFVADLTRAETLEGPSPAGVNKTFRHYDQSQQFLIPPSLEDRLPAEHPARFISDTVDRALDLAGIYDSYASAAGAPPFAPQMMLKLLLYGYSTGVTSSRAIEQRCHDDVALRWLVPTRPRTTDRSRAFAAVICVPSRRCSPSCSSCARERVS
jgi:hypothetical protein